MVINEIWHYSHTLQGMIRIDIFPEDGLEVGIFILEEMKYKKFLNLLLLDP